MRTVSNPFSNFKYDIPSSIVVFLVALPLCLGIALASGAPMFSGIIAGIVGGIVIGSLSGSNLSVSGPAAGLTTIVSAAILDLNTYEAFLCAVVLAGFFQLLLGVLKAGVIGNFFPASVIKGMLAAIGLILILKQIPHAVGFDADFEGDESFQQADGENTFTEIINAFQHMTMGPLIIGLLSLFILILWDKPWVRKIKFFQWVPGALAVVVVGVVINAIYLYAFPELVVGKEHLVSLQTGNGASGFFDQFMFPDFSVLLDSKIYLVAVTIALVASLESILSIEAVDKLDPYKRITPLNRELRAQGIGNIVSGLIGGLPITAVIVRSSANVNAGARTKTSAILHGMLLMTSVVAIPGILNMIPLSSLAAILIMTGFKLVKPSLVRDMARKGWSQFIPFIVTIAAILFTNLLYGIFIGTAVGLFYVLRTNFHEAVSVVNTGTSYLLKLNKDVSFLNKATIKKTFEQIPDGSAVTIDGGNSQFIDADITECIEDFVSNAPNRNIRVELKKSHSSQNGLFRKVEEKEKMEV